jgi:predicted permease
MGAGNAGGWRALALATARDPKVVSPLLGIGLGLALAAWAGPRPRALGDLQAVVVPASTAAVMYAVGLTLDVGRVGAYLGDCLGMCALKFLASPLVALGLVLLLAPGHDAARVALLLATMPSAINATVIASLFRLDVDAANACFLVTTGVFLALVLPVIAIALRGA